MLGELQSTRATVLLCSSGIELAMPVSRCLVGSSVQQKLACPFFSPQLAIGCPKVRVATYYSEV